MVKNQVTTDLFLAVVDSWQQYKGGEKIDPDLCDIIELHLNYAYVCGFDEISTKITKFLKLNYDPAKNKHSMGIKYLLEYIDEIYEQNEINRDDT